MDYVRPVEALIPGARGRVLGALSRVGRELTLRAVAEVAHTSPAQTSRVLSDLVHLGVVGRRDVPPAALFWLVEGNVVAEIVRELGHVDDAVIKRLRAAAGTMRPQPANVTLFGSFARGEADAESDIDILVVRPGETDDDEWDAEVERWADHVHVVSGSTVRLLLVGEHEIRKHLREPRGVWRSILDEGLHLGGVPMSELEGTRAQ